MRHVRSLELEPLEARKLLAKAHPALAHITPAALVGPLVLDGTLTVDTKGATTTTDQSGDTITSTPVAGKLGALGEVRGAWNEAVNSFGDYVGPDTLQLHDSQGGFIIAFNNGSPGKPHKTAHGALYYQMPQRFYEGTGAYANSAKAAESGTIQLTTNNARSAIVSMTLNTPTT
ncbi:MAG: hypothetical protein P4L84_04745 [Isosphaeraceae bacterium]|nr:hypothetical protein [Isosphaeraceae bacterium]